MHDVCTARPAVKSIEKYLNIPGIGQNFVQKMSGQIMLGSMVLIHSPLESAIPVREYLPM